MTAPSRQQERLAALWSRRPLALSAAALLVAALLLRSGWFGSPLAGYDEQLYLLIGDRMLDGALPYVDLWDRKPVGLFVLYAGIRLLGGDGVLEYQLVATLFAAATAFVILLVVRRRFAPFTSLACALLYLLWAGTMGGEAGQAPVFYNLFVAGAALLLLDALPAMATRAGIVRAAAAMLLCGLAITVKTTAVFEGAFFGLATLVACLRAGYTLPRLAAAAVGFAALGILPFAAAAAVYWSLGHFDAFWFANAQSALLRTGDPNGRTLGQIALTLMGIAPALLLTLASRRRSLAAPVAPEWEARFMTGWLIAAAVGFASVGYFLQHYALPLLVPMSIAAARFVEGSRHGRLAVLLFALYPLFHQVVLSRLMVHGDRAAVTAMVEAISGDVDRECMLLFGAPTVLYHLTDACLVTPYAFSDHLYRGDEAHAIGTDAAAATAAALARRPAVIVTDERAFPAFVNTRSVALVRAALARDYVRRAVVPYQYFADADHTATVWVRR